VTRAACYVRHPQGQQRRLGILGLQPLGDQMVERVLDERLDQLVRRVVRARVGALIALLECKGGLRAVKAG